jgi:type VI secretion system protein
MPLTLRIQSYRKQAPAAAVEHRFDQLGGTIGRGASNDMVLPDPGKYISRNHCKVDFTDGRFTIIDLGSNPSWINDRPLGTGKSAVIENGDRLMIGDYELHAEVDAAPAPAVPVFQPDYSPAAPFQAQPAPARREPVLPDYVNPGDTLSGARILDTGIGLGAASANDPLGLGPMQGGADPLAFRGSEFDHAAPQFIPMPSATARVAVPAPVPASAPVPAPARPASAASLIPDDYDPLADFLPPRAQARPAPPPVQNMAPAAAPAPAGGDSEVLAALLRGLGLPGLQTKRSPAETAELVGAMLREATAGTMAVLTARAMTKRESRMDLTVMGAQANNPLKFFPDAESALSQMLTNAMAGYMPPMKSIGSAFDDLKAHEMAVIAGMRAALAGVMARFNPAVIEHRMEPEGVMDKMLAANRKAKMWDLMVALYDEISHEAQDDFQHLFGEKFSAAYEDQIGRLHQERR